MRVSLSWLGDYLDLGGLSPEQIAAAFTEIGLECEAIERQTAFQGEVVVGEVLTAIKHPNADSLRLCTVAVGEAEPLQIVCGAPNARPGIKVVVAKSGATLPGDFKIKKSKIRGEVSNGMMCSEKELQLSDAHGGIIELPGDAAVGGSAAAALGLGDTVLEINVTPNRGDCLGMIGLARDLGAKLGRPLRLPDLGRIKRDAGTKSAGHVKVEIADPQGSSRFVALRVDGVQVAPSPAWLQKRLTAAGMRPINLIVDATNYVMLEYSQPVHAYDAREVKGATLKVVAADGPSTLTTLDGQARSVAAGDLLIADRDAALGFAGIMGGQSSEVRGDTSALVIEVAAFSAARIRRTAKRLGLKTEASHRFERGVDVDNLPSVALRVAGIIAQGSEEQGLPAPRIAADLVDCYPADVEKRVVALRLAHARQFLGLTAPLARDEVVRILKALEFELLDEAGDRLVFEVPYFRTDVEREVDLIEEVGRLLGFDKVPYTLPTMSIRPTPEDPFIDFQEAARAVLGGLGLRETASFPFVSAGEMAALALPPDHPLYPSLTLRNPLNEASGMLQTSLLPGLLRAVQLNRRHGDKGVRLFEAGRGYFLPAALAGRTAALPALRGLARAPRHLARQARGEEGRPVERHWVAAVLDQPHADKSWDGPAVPASFFHGKAVVVTLVRALTSAEPQLEKVDPAVYPFLHPGAAAAVLVGGRPAGYVGELHPNASTALDFGADGPVVLELDVEVLFDAKEKAARAARAAVEVQRFPPVTRDLAFVVDRDKTHGDFTAAIGKFKRRHFLAQYELFDVYHGKNLPEGKKSMAYSFAFRSPDRTLAETDVEPEIQGLIQWLSEALGATLRA